MMPPAAVAIDHLKELPANWDTYGATAPDDATLARALACLATVTQLLGPAYGQPEVRPIPDPGVALTWRDRGRHSDVKVLITPTSVEWVQLKNRHIVEQGSISDPQQFRRFTQRILSSVTL